MEPFTHKRPDGRRVVLSGPRWRLEVRDAEGHLTEAPQEWLVEHFGGARAVTLRKCAEPIRFGAELAADVMMVAVQMARTKPGERLGVETALTNGRPITLANLLRGFDGRKTTSGAVADTRALVDRVKAAERAAVAALDPALVERLDAWMAGATAS